jgi:hypothetical protein
MDGLSQLIHFAKRSAVFAMRERNLEHCNVGLRALALIDMDRADQDDARIALGLIDHAASKLGADRDALYREPETLALPVTAKVIRKAHQLEASKRALEEWGFLEVETPRGVGLAQVPFGSYGPSVDLFGVGLKASEYLDGTRHDVEDPRMDCEIPAVWFKDSKSDALKAKLSTLRGVVIVGSALGRSSRDLPAQVVYLFLAEAPTDADAAWLANQARGPLQEGGAALGVAEGRLLAIMTGRSFKLGTPSEETPESVARLLEGVRPFLKEAQLPK